MINYCDVMIFKMLYVVNIMVFVGGIFECFLEMLIECFGIRYVILLFIKF